MFSDIFLITIFVITYLMLWCEREGGSKTCRMGTQKEHMQQSGPGGAY